ncbi:hypothetical protein ACFLYU_00480 [Candidatus Dependentiae bacterium]
MEKQLSYRGNEVASKNSPNIIIPALTILLFVVLVGVSLYKMLYDVKISSDVIIAREVRELVDIFKKIDKKCKIIDFDYQKNRINFLNVKSFVGSEVGPMNLTYPKNWEGPYLQDNPTIQDKEYQVVRTKKGHFITPGDGVKLSNGKIVGKDIILDENADIPKMMVDEKFLNFKGEALAAPLDVGTSNLGKVILENIIRTDEGLTHNDGYSPQPECMLASN